MRFRLTALIVAALPAAVLFARVAPAATNTVGSAADTVVTNHPGLGGTSGVNGSDSTMYAIGTGGFESHPLVRFDLSAFAGHSVSGSPSFRLFLNGGQSPVSTNSFDLHRALVNWDETTSWDTFGPLPGYNVGTDYDSTPAATQVVTSASSGSYVSFPLPLPLVQGWIDNPATNFGLFMHAAGAAAGNDLRFSSREGANTPQLVFDSTLIPEPGALVLAAFGCVAIFARRSATVQRRHCGPVRRTPK